MIKSDADAVTDLIESDTESCLTDSCLVFGTNYGKC